MQIGIAGTGRMGTAIAKRLAGLGHRLVVWNRTPAGADAAVAAGAARAATPAALVGEVDVVISLLTDAAAIESVYGGADGVLAAVLDGKLVIEMSTAQPQTQRDLAARVLARGAGFVESPVGGSVGPALEGKLFGFVGGSDAHAARARPVLELLCRRIEHLGPVGSGASMKLAINLPLMVYWQAFGEALSLIDDLGLDAKRVVDIFADTSGAPAMFKTRAPLLAQALGGSTDGPVTVNVATIRKDLRTMLAEGDALDRSLPVAAQALACFDRAAAGGADAADCTQLPVWWARQGGRKAGA